MPPSYFSDLFSYACAFRTSLARQNYLKLSAKILFSIYGNYLQIWKGSYFLDFDVTPSPGAASMLDSLWKHLCEVAIQGHPGLRN